MLDARAALVTGGSRGIGLGICRALARDGVALAVNGVRPEEDVKDVLQELRISAPEVIYCQGDVSIAEQRAHMIQTIRSRYGRLDILVNNAGVAPTARADMLDATEESFDRVLGINLKGPFFLTQTVARWMVDQAAQMPDFKGCIVNVTSISAEAASISRGDYCLSKAAMSMASRLWAVRMAEHGIPVFEVRPGIIRTDMTAAVQEKYDRLIGDGLLLEPRWGTPDDVGRSVALLVRGELPYATGSVLTIDGGLSVPRL